MGVPPPPALAPYLRLQQATDRQVLFLLLQTAQRVDVHLQRLESKAGIGGQVRRSQLRLQQVAIQRELVNTWERIGQVAMAAQVEAAAEGAATAFRATEHVLEGLFSAADRAAMMASVKASAPQALRTAQERLSGTSYVPLSERVYDSAALTNKKVDEVINGALARGASARELAQDVREFIRPDTPGGLRYAANRLARTELNNAFHASQVRQADEMPWVTAVQWHLSGSHPVPDECNQYAEESHYPDGPAGHFRTGQVPGKPHPNCLCYTTPVAVDEDEFADAYMAGQYDAYLTEQFPDLDFETRAAPTGLPGAPAPTGTAQPAPAGGGAGVPVPPLPPAPAAPGSYRVGGDRLYDIISNIDRTAFQSEVATAYLDEILQPLLKKRGMTGHLADNRYGNPNRFQIDLFDGGEPVGYMIRTIDLDRDGELFVSHDLFKLNANKQGTGLANDFIKVAEDWYRAHNIRYIEVHANIDVGGYTWAKQGYGWSEQQSKRMVEDLVGNLLLDVRSVLKSGKFKGEPMLATADMEATVKAWLKATDSTDPADWPSPYDMAMLGYTEGAEMWLGKKYMLGKDWYGRKDL